MSSISTLLAVRDGLVAALKAATWPTAAPTVYGGVPAVDELPAECIIIGGATSATRQHATSRGTQPRADETYRLECALSVYVAGDGTAAAQCATRTDALWAVILDTVRAAVTQPAAGGPLGIAQVYALDIDTYDVEDLNTPESNEMLITFYVRAVARV